MDLDLTKMPFGNGAGAVKTLEQVKQACRSSVTQVTVGSVTFNERPGNIGETYYYHPTEHWSLNSLGLPNVGMVKYLQLMPDLVRICKDNNKELWFSIAGFSPDEYGVMARELLTHGADGVELNLSCPNVWTDGKPKRMPAEDPSLARAVFVTVQDATQKLNNRKFKVKLSPTRDVELLGLLAHLIHFYGMQCVVCSNTIPQQQRKKEDGTEALRFKSSESDKDYLHSGGLAGSAALEGGVRMVAHMKELLHPSIGIIGLGGIFSGADAKRYLDAGATGFQSTTGCLEYGYQLFTDIIMELA